MMNEAVAPYRATEIPEPPIARFLFADTRLAIFWTIIRLYVGYEWLVAGWGKFTNPAGVWVGPKAGSAIVGFAQGALKKVSGDIYKQKHDAQTRPGTAPATPQSN